MSTSNQNYRPGDAPRAAPHQRVDDPNASYIINERFRNHNTYSDPLPDVGHGVRPRGARRCLFPRDMPAPPRVGARAPSPLRGGHLTQPGSDRFSGAPHTRVRKQSILIGWWSGAYSQRFCTFALLFGRMPSSIPIAIAMRRRSTYTRRWSTRIGQH